jgi:hypothetical protein
MIYVRPYSFNHIKCMLYMLLLCKIIAVSIGCSLYCIPFRHSYIYIQYQPLLLFNSISSFTNQLNSVNLKFKKLHKCGSSVGSVCVLCRYILCLIVVKRQPENVIHISGSKVQNQFTIFGLFLLSFLFLGYIPVS